MSPRYIIFASYADSVEPFFAGNLDFKEVPEILAQAQWEHYGHWEPLFLVVEVTCSGRSTVVYSNFIKANSEILEQRTREEFEKLRQKYLDGLTEGDIEKQREIAELRRLKEKYPYV